VLQPQYNLVERPQFEGPLQDVCVARGIAAVPYYGLASGFLTGKYRSQADLEGKTRGRAVQKYLNGDGLRVLAALDKVAGEAGATPAQVALAWLTSQPAVAAPIASATSVPQVEELLGAMRSTLTKAQVDLLDAASRK
jgi:aryl-alcohol dehydrogenase-like predicted oxidoreductase